MDTLLHNNPRLRRNFNGCVLGGAHFNFGPQTCTFRHTDHLNIVYGGCPIFAIGNFDPKKGGHLVLWDLKLVVEFPPGSVIILPSALIEHSNVPVQEHETRMSFAQYCAAGLFRWVHNGCMSDLDFQRTASVEELAQWKADKKRHWAEGLAKLTVWHSADTSLA